MMRSSDTGFFRMGAVGAAAWGIAMAGCGIDAGIDSDRSRAEVSVRDSAGVEVVEVPETLLTGLPVWRFTADPVLSIGVADGDEAYLFNRISAAARLETGEFVVADGGSLELRVFDSDGRFARKYGGRGEGPGEFQALDRLGPSDGRRISAFDYPNGRVTTVDLLTGEARSHPQELSCREPHEAQPRSCNVAVVLPDGRAISTPRGLVGPNPGPDDLVLRQGPTVRFGILEGELSTAFDSIPPTPMFVHGFGTSEYINGTALFERGGAAAFGAEVVVIGDATEFELRWRDAQGDLFRIVRVRARPVPVTADSIAARRTWADTASRAHPVVRRYLNSLSPDGTVPFFSDLSIDRAGRLWVRDYRASPILGPTPPDAWTIFGPDGLPLARVEGGAPGAILETGEDYLLVRYRDDLGIEYVRMHGIEGPEG